MLLNFAAPRIPVQTVQTSAQPSYDINALLNLADSQYSGLQKVGDTEYYYGNNRMYKPTSYSGGKGAPANMETFGGQNFVPVDADIAGFNKSKGEDDIYTYDPSMAYVYSQAPQPTYTPTSSASSFLSAPTMPSYEGNYGAGRFLNTGNLLGFNFTPAQTTSSPGQSPAI